MARNFKNMSKAELISHASSKGREIATDASDNEILIEVLRTRPSKDAGNRETVVGNITRFEDQVHVNHVDNCAIVENYLTELGSYSTDIQPELGNWLTVNCPQLFPEHCFSHGPNDEKTEYWITVSGTDANVQWIIS